jgi:Concanavalin A-like lectin/glucanases superfamily
MDGTVLDDDGVTAAVDLAKLQVNGRLNLDGFGSYVDLPDGLISSLGSATFEAWLAWRGGAFWSRIFDFGSTNGGGLGQTYLFLTPSNSATTSLRAVYSVAGGGAAETLLDAPAALPIAGQAGGALEHVAVVIDDVQGMMRLHSNGVEVGAVALPGDLAALDDVNNWLGRSNYSVDPPLFGSLIEFRIYDQALTATQIGTSFQAGPGALD